MVQPPSDGWCVLLVDDDEDDYIITSTMLAEAKSRKIELDWAQSYHAAKTLLASRTYDAVLVDYDLGEVTGLQLIRELVANGFPSPLILFTGRGSYSVDVEAMEAGATLYLTKAEASTLLLERFIRYAIERKHAEEILRQHNLDLEAAREEAEAEKRRLEAVFNALPVGVAIVDEAGGVISFNETYDSIWKGPIPETRSVNDYAAFHAWWADSGKAVEAEEWASAQAVQKGETIIGQIFQIQRFDGSHAIVLNSAAPVRNRRGAIIGSAVAIQDITDLRRIEAALKRTEENYRNLFETMDEGVALLQIIYDENGAPVDYIYLDVNRAYETVIGVSRSERIGRRASQEYGRPINLEILGKVASTGQPALAEVYVPQLQKYLRTSAFSTEQGKVAIIFTDITERKRDEDLMHQQNEQIQRAFDVSPALLGYIDAGYFYRWVNKGYEAWFGRSAHEIIDQPVEEVLGREAWDLLRPFMDRALGGEQVFFELKLPLIHGGSRWVYGSYTPDRYENGVVQGFMVHVVDISKRKQAP